MASSFYFLKAEESDTKRPLLDGIKQYSDQNKQQVYIIDKPLGGNKYDYDFDDSLLVLMPNHKLIFINFSDSQKDFDDYVEDFIEDLGSLSDKYEYKKIIGRPRQWRNELVAKESFNDSLLDIANFLERNRLKR
ncbi:MAG: hypothetical protein ACTFAL_05940 [Candidatus Electronema sp. V4]|uniref:hypothetical protein n=1 Tax=Candidatus Electronema sp. V4 TaxID=3454756 RepID=UPI0040557FC9